MDPTPAFDAILTELIAAYRVRATNLARIEQALLADGIIATRTQLTLDHIAFRTFADRHLGIESLAGLLMHYGYARRDALLFPAKHLHAYWFSPPVETLPRVFVSELRVDALSPAAVEIIRSSTAAVPRAPLAEIDLNDADAVVGALATRPWPSPSAAAYHALLDESEYAAWTLVNGYALNHVTLSVDGLRHDLQSIAALNPYVEALGIELNAAGGKIKISPDTLLVQSSTRAERFALQFADGRPADVAGPYIEFAERRVLPQFAGLPPAQIRREHRRDGFEASNADRIFESTRL